MVTPKRDIPHTCQCDCPSCELNQRGYFAQRAVLDGDDSAAQGLAPPIVTVLTAERARRLAKRSKCAA